MIKHLKKVSLVLKISFVVMFLISLIFKIQLLTPFSLLILAVASIISFYVAVDETRDEKHDC